MAKDMSELMPESMKKFGEFGEAIGEESDLDLKTRELITLAYGIAHQCDDCINYHAGLAADAGATENEIATVVAIGVAMGGGPGSAFGHKALQAYYAKKGE